MEDIPGRFSFQRPSERRSQSRSMSIPNSRLFHPQQFPHSEVIAELARKLDTLPIPHFHVTAKSPTGHKLQGSVHSSKEVDLVQVQWYQFPCYFLVFHNAAFALLLLPFRIKQAFSGSATRQRVCPHTALAAVMHLLVFLGAVVRIAANLGIKLRGDPSKIFDLVSAFAYGGLLLTFMYSGWRKQESLQRMCRQFKRKKGMMPCKTWAIVVGICLIPFLQYGITIANKAVQLHNDKGSERNLAVELWGLWMNASRHKLDQRCSGNLTEEYNVEPVLRGVGYACIFLHYFLAGLFRTFAGILVLIAALSVREISGRCLYLLELLPRLSLSTISNMYLEMVSEIELINDWVSPIVLGWFILTASFFLETFFELFSNSSAGMKAFNVCCACHNMLTMVMAVKAHKNIAKVKSILLKRKGVCNPNGEEGDDAPVNLANFVDCDQYLSPAFVGYLAISEEDIGIRGSDFFVINGTFIFGMFSSLVTYLLIMLQFNPEPASGVTTLLANFSGNSSGLGPPQRCV